MKKGMDRAMKHTYLRKVRELSLSVRAGELSLQEASACAAGALLKIWDAYNFTPATAMGRHLCALENGRIDVEANLLGREKGEWR